MPIKSRFAIEIPRCSLPTFLLESPTAPLDDKKRQFLDAANPDSRFFTKASFRLWCQRFAAGLRKAGLQRGDRVLLFSGNDMFYPVVFLGVIMAGGIFSGANPSFVPRELAYQLEDSAANFLICNEAVLDTGIQAAGTIGMTKDQIFVFNGDDPNDRSPGLNGCRNWTELLVSEEEGRNFMWDDLRAPGECNTTMALNYSSGTTGMPKGVEITHLNYVSNTAQMCYLDCIAPEFEEKQKTARQLCFLPLYHAMAQTIFLANSIKKGTPVYIMKKFDFLKMLQYTENHRITSLVLVPPILVAIAKHPAVKQFDLSHVRYIGSGAAPLGREIIAEVESKFPQAQDIHIKQGWGMTETTCSILGVDPNDIRHDSSVGEPNPNCEIAIMPPSNEIDLQQFEPDLELPRNSRGELWARGPNIMKGYWRKPKATATTLTRDGWLKTGDICFIDEHNHVFIVDRLKELIKVKGNQVAPAELEALLLDIPGIADAAVIGVPDDQGGERVRAYTVRQPGAQVSENEVIEWIKERCVRHKWITAGVRFIDAIPKTASGKIVRRQLKEMLKEEQQQRARL